MRRTEDEIKDHSENIRILEKSNILRIAIFILANFSTPINDEYSI